MMHDVDGNKISNSSEFLSGLLSS